MYKGIKELNDSFIVITRKIKQLKRNITIGANANTDNICRNSNAIYDHDVAQNPVDIISDELISVQPVSSGCMRSCKFDVKIITYNELNHVCEENNTDNNNFVSNSQVDNNYEKSNTNPEIDCTLNDIYDFHFAKNPDDDFSNSAKSNGTGCLLI